MKQMIYMGWDSREPTAYDVARKSILRRTNSKTTHVLPLELQLLKPILDRPIEIKDGKMWCPISKAPMATEFAISRFIVPLLRRHGFALFVDCDIICMEDIKNLFDLADPQYAVQVVKHDHKPTDTVKMDGQIQTVYPRKNWSSVILWNCDHPANKSLTKEALNSWPGRDLHGFKWLKDEEIGELPRKWNQLVGVQECNPASGILHYTLGGPWFKNWEPKPFDDVWLAEKKACLG